PRRRTSSATAPFFFFFQAEDGIRDSSVTGVQTCALPIFLVRAVRSLASGTATPRPQDPSLATTAPKLAPEEQWIAWDEPAPALIDRKSVRVGKRGRVRSAKALASSRNIENTVSQVVEMTL